IPNRSPSSHLASFGAAFAFIPCLNFSLCRSINLSCEVSVPYPPEIISQHAAQQKFEFFCSTCLSLTFLPMSVLLVFLPSTYLKRVSRQASGSGVVQSLRRAQVGHGST